MVIIGLGGLAKDILTDLLTQYSREELLFYSEVSADVNLLFFQSKGLSTSANVDDVISHFRNIDKRFLVLIGNNEVRERLVEKYTSMGGEPYCFISPSANVSLELCDISTKNTVLMHSSMISAGAVIKDGCIISQYAYIGHDCVVEKYVFIGGYSGISGGSVGEYTFIGVKSVVLPGRSLGKKVAIGAMTMVNKSIGDGKKAYGVPAKEHGPN